MFVICFQEIVMAEWGTPPGMIDSEIRSESPANDLRTAQLEKRRQLMKQKEKKKRDQQLRPIGRNEVSSARRREGKTPLVTETADPNELGSRYAYDGPESYNNDSYQVNNADNTKTRVHVVNVTPDNHTQSDSSSLEDETPTAEVPPPQVVVQQTKPTKKKSASATKKQQPPPKIEEQKRAFGSDDEDDLDTAVIPDASPRVCDSIDINYVLRPSVIIY